MSRRGDITAHLVTLPPGPGAWTTVSQSPPFPDQWALYSTGQVQFRLLVGNVVVGGPYLHDPVAQLPPSLALPPSAMLQLRNPAAAGLNVLAIVARNIVATTADFPETFPVRPPRSLSDAS